MKAKGKEKTIIIFSRYFFTAHLPSSNNLHRFTTEEKTGYIFFIVRTEENKTNESKRQGKDHNPLLYSSLGISF